MRRTLAVLCVAMVAGCGDPENDVLAPGTKAVVVGPYDSPARDGTNRKVSLPPGTRVTVGHDPGDFQENILDVERNAELAENYSSDQEAGKAEAEAIRKRGPRFIKHSESGSQWRKVRVVVDSSNYAGQALEVIRKDLRAEK